MAPTVEGWAHEALDSRAALAVMASRRATPSGTPEAVELLAYGLIR